jgi:hypothetical protein
MFLTLPLQALQPNSQALPWPARVRKLFAGMSLMESFDVKTRGIYPPNQRNPTRQNQPGRPGRCHFFSVVNLLKPQISLAPVNHPQKCFTERRLSAKRRSSSMLILAGFGWDSTTSTRLVETLSYA